MATIQDRVNELNELNGKLRGDQFQATDAMATLLCIGDLMLQFGKPSIGTLSQLLVEQQVGRGVEDHVAKRVLEQAFQGLGIIAKQVDDIQLLFGVVTRLINTDAPVEELQQVTQTPPADLVETAVAPPPPPPLVQEQKWTGDEEHEVGLPDGMGGNIRPA